MKPNTIFAPAAFLITSLCLVFAGAGAALRGQSPAKIDPLVLGLRDALYADASLEELVDQFEVLPSMQKPVGLIRDGKYDQALRELEGRPNPNAFVPAVVRAFAYRAQGNRARTIPLLRTLAGSKDVRIQLQGHRLLREAGVKPAASAAGRALGAIIETNGASGEALALAGFADGQARLYFRDGRSFSDNQKPAVRKFARELLQEVYRVSNRMQMEKSRNLPGSGTTRFVLLTPGAVKVALVPTRDLNKPGHRFAKVFAAALKLQALFTESGETQTD